MSSASRLAACLVTPSSSASRVTVGCSAATARITKPNDGRIVSPPAVATAATSRSATQRLAAASGSRSRARSQGPRRREHLAVQHGAPAGAHAATARNGSCSPTWKENSAPGAQDEAVAGADGCSVPSTTATAGPLWPKNISSQSMWCGGLVLPAASSTGHRLICEAPRDGAA